ncbi:MAG TPA: hypothetical protein VK158_00470 [Acidobacteriota bacterium]|nr:hypothetical protein [Acidobacteriota bacterium]
MTHITSRGLALLGLLILTILLTGCSAKYSQDPLYCEKDSDCTLQPQACNGCACPTAINKFNVHEIECKPSQFSCALQCFTQTRCVEQKCILLD